MSLEPSLATGANKHSTGCSGDVVCPISPTPSYHSTNTATTSYTSSSQRSPILSPASTHTSDVSDEYLLSPSGSHYESSVHDADYDAELYPEDINAMKKGLDVCRERGAGRRALSLLNKSVVGDDDKSDKSGSEGGGGIGLPRAVIKFRNEHRNAAKVRQAAIERYEKKKANRRALALLDEAVVGSGDEGNTSDRSRLSDNSSSSGGSRSGGSRSGGSHRSAREVRREAIQRYERKKLERMIIRQRYEADREKWGKKSIVGKHFGKEKLAETSRKITPKTNDDGLLECETIKAMKCQMDLDREQEAQTKALRLLNEGCFL